MRKTIAFVLFMLLIIPLISAIDLDIEKQESNPNLIKSLESPAIFNLKITNWGSSGNFEFYNLLGFMMSPNMIYIKQGETKNVVLRVFPIGDLGTEGLYKFKYTIRADDKSEIDDYLTVKITKLEDAFETGANEFDPQSSSLEVYLQNKLNFDFNNIDAEFTSPFFKFKESFTLSPNEKKSFNINLNKEDFKKLMAGFYTLKTEIITGGKKANIEGVLKFIEKNLVTTSEDNYGFLITTKSIEKINEGNVLVKSETILKKNIISRLFTTFNIKPDIVERQGLTIYYTWLKDIAPGESLKITAKTNWLFPFLAIVFITLIVFFTKKYSLTNLSLRKKVSFVRAKGGEFALKISIIVNARKYIEKISIMDRLPPLVKIHERFGGEQPKRINEKQKRIEWEFEKLEPGEHRILSYIIYSKIGVLGKIALPTATAIYEKDGKVHEEQSNRTFFIAEQGKRKIED